MSRHRRRRCRWPDRRRDAAKVGRLRAGETWADEAAAPAGDPELDALRELASLDARVAAMPVPWRLADKVDRAIINAALALGRVAGSRIAASVKVNRSTVSRRLRRLLDPALPIVARVLLEETTPEALESALRARSDNLVQRYLDAEARAQTADAGERPAILRDLRSINGAIRRTASAPETELFARAVRHGERAWLGAVPYIIGAEYLRGVPRPRCPICGRYVSRRATYCGPTCRQRARRKRAAK